MYPKKCVPNFGLSGYYETMFYQKLSDAFYTMMQSLIFKCLKVNMEEKPLVVCKNCNEEVVEIDKDKYEPGYNKTNKIVPAAFVTEMKT